MLIFDDITLEKSTDQMKKDFFSYASHELKSPLTSIRGYAELIEHHMVPAKEQSEIASKIVSQSNIMSRLVEDMLMLSRLENYQESKRIQVHVDIKLKEGLTKEDLIYLIIKKSGGVSKMKVNNQVASNPIGFYESGKNFADLPCRLTHFTRTNFEKYNEG